VVARVIAAGLTGVACGLLNGFLVASLNIPSLVITIARSSVPRSRTGPDERTGVPLLVDKYPQMHTLLREPLFGVPVQTLWMVAF